LGSVCSFLQQFLDAHNQQTWSVFTSNIPKLVLSVESTAFDVLFLVQHYVWYRSAVTTSLESTIANMHMAHPATDRDRHYVVLSTSARGTGQD
jgi:hypothetical protein